MVQVTEPQAQVPEFRLVMVEARARKESQPLIAEPALLHASTVTASRQPTSNEGKKARDRLKRQPRHTALMCSSQDSTEIRTRAELRRMIKLQLRAVGIPTTRPRVVVHCLPRGATRSKVRENWVQISLGREGIINNSIVVSNHIHLIMAISDQQQTSFRTP